MNDMGLWMWIGVLMSTGIGVLLSTVYIYGMIRTADPVMLVLICVFIFRANYKILVDFIDPITASMYQRYSMWKSRLLYMIERIKGRSSVICSNSEESVFESEMVFDLSPDRGRLKEIPKFCSLFSSSYEFDKNTMVQMWVAQGLFEPENFVPMEILADDVFDYLVQEKVIQSIRYDNICEGFIYRMVLPRLTSNDKFVEEEPKEPRRVSESAEHVSDSSAHANVCLSVDKSELSKLSEFTETILLVSRRFNPFLELTRFKNLFTLILVCEKGFSVKHVPRELFLILKDLRLLSLRRTGISELPSSIGNLKRLRYLDVSETPIISLPETTDSLSELQTLKLQNCSGISKLPRDLKKLANLRHLDLDIIGRLNSMPIGIGNLTKLQTLSAFLVDNVEGYRIGELKNLNNLKGSLSLRRLDNVSTPEEAAEANLIEKKFLSKLELQWEIYPVDRSEIQKKILDCLQPPSSVVVLEISYYSGSSFPNWLGDPLYLNIVTLDLYKCENCHHVPSLGGLLSLRFLSLTELNGVKTIDQLFRNTKKSPVIQAFPMLQKLSIDVMLNLERWTGIKGG